MLEVALTGSALPVLLSVCLGTDSTHPENTEHDFGRCLVGERREATCTVRNKCAVLPVDFQFRRVAHFSAKPAAGKIQRQETHKGTLSFVPNQIGKEAINNHKTLTFVQPKAFNCFHVSNFIVTLQ